MATVRNSPLSNRRTPKRLWSPQAGYGPLVKFPTNVGMSKYEYLAGSLSASSCQSKRRTGKALEMVDFLTGRPEAECLVPSVIFSYCFGKRRTNTFHELKINSTAGRSTEQARSSFRSCNAVFSSICPIWMRLVTELEADEP